MSSSEDEDFATFGTPLDPIEEDEVRRKRPRTVEDQVVTDKEGRRRFHGAFTGGFSAGYFNSVGTREGWKPSTFKSSRSEKSQGSVQRPEDFMDDEDMEEFGIAPKVVKLKDEYDDTTKKDKRKFIGNDGPIPGQPVLHGLIQPVRTTVGVQMLKKMGWKIGQGIGPRLNKRQKKKESGKNKNTAKIYGCSLPESNERIPKSSSEEDSEDEEEITFAPDDYNPFVVKPKDNSFGIGYSGLDRRKILSGHINLFDTTFTVQEKSKKFSIKGQGFGVGALEDEDEDIYNREDMSQYDFTLESKEPKKPKKSATQFPAIAAPNDPIEGFMPAQTIVRKKLFPPPKIPPGFQPVHGLKKSRFEPVASTSNERTSNKPEYHRGDLTAVERAVILDEPLPSAKTLYPTVPDEKAKEESIKQAFGGSFKPFLATPDKQKRYEQYLRLVKNGQKDKLSILQPLSMTEWERERERVEFEQAERLYKPLSVEFSDRFVSASQPDDVTNPLAEVQRTVDDQNDMREAAKKKMFGKLTRKYYDWAPASLLCKRFNIPEPLSGLQNRSGNKPETKRPKFSVFNFLEATNYNSFPSQSKASETSDRVSPDINEGKLLQLPGNSVKEILPNQVEIEEMVAVTEKENEKKESSAKGLEDMDNKDLYKAIFLSSSEESDDEEESKEKNVQKKDSTSQNSTKTFEPSPHVSEKSSKSIFEQQLESLALKNALRNTSPPRGIFANLDLDAINAKRSEKGQTSKADNPEKIEESTSKKTEDDALLYGPKLPTNFTPKKETPKIILTSKSDSDSSDSVEWIESNDVSKSKKKQKKSHKKKSKSHHKHKKLKKHKH